MRVEAIEPADYEAAIPGLAALIVDSVESGSSVNFLAGVSADEAAAWWRERAQAVRNGSISVFVARDGDRILGSTLLARAAQPNGPHRAEIGKVIVHRSARRQGVGRALMRAAEEAARTEGRWLLILDTETGSPAAALYEAIGWQRAGEIPNFALTAAGELIGTTYYWKDLR